MDLYRRRSAKSRAWNAVRLADSGDAAAARHSASSTDLAPGAAAVPVPVPVGIVRVGTVGTVGTVSVRGIVREGWEFGVSRGCVSAVHGGELAVGDAGEHHEVSPLGRDELDGVLAEGHGDGDGRGVGGGGAAESVAELAEGERLGGGGRGDLASDAGGVPRRDAGAGEIRLELRDGSAVVGVDDGGDGGIARVRGDGDARVRLLRVLRGEAPTLERPRRGRARARGDARGVQSLAELVQGGGARALQRQRVRRPARHSLLTRRRGHHRGGRPLGNVRGDVPQRALRALAQDGAAAPGVVTRPAAAELVQQARGVRVRVRGTRRRGGSRTHVEGGAKCGRRRRAVSGARPAVWRQEGGGGGGGGGGELLCGRRSRAAVRARIVVHFLIVV